MAPMSCVYVILRHKAESQQKSSCKKWQRGVIHVRKGAEIMPELKHSIAYLYFQQTKFNRESINLLPRPDIRPAEPFKRYEKAEKVLLPRKWDGEETNFWELLQKRRSERRYTGGPLSKLDLALLLWASQGVTAQAGPYYLRTAPSAGALYPIETYLAVEAVNEIDPGIFHFDVRGFQLERLSSNSPAADIANCALGQGFLRKASVTFVWTSIFRRNMAKYGHRGLRYILLDAGHICQNLLLAAEALGLGSCPVAAFYDDELNALLGLDGQEESVLYMAGVGVKA